MRISRRNFLVLATFAFAGCRTVGGGGRPADSAGRVVNAGRASEYTADGVYDRFCDQGFFLIRRGGVLRALSAICTHRHCRLDVESDRSFFCPCHGSMFDPAGKVTRGPARRDLPELAVFTDESGQLFVKVPAP